MIKAPNSDPHKHCDVCLTCTEQAQVQAIGNISLKKKNVVLVWRNYFHIFTNYTSQGAQLRQLTQHFN